MWRSIFCVVTIFVVNLANLATAAAWNNSTLSVSGMVMPVFTPFNEDYTINFNIIPKYSQYIANLNVRAVLVGGTTGEHMTLTVEERALLLDAWVKVANDFGMKIIAQVGGGPLQSVIYLAKHAEDLGVAAILTLPELYYRPKTVNDLVDYVEIVAGAVPKTPVLYYHHPSKSNVQLSMPEFVKAATARIPNFKGLKFTSSNLNEAYSTLKSLKEDQDLFLASPSVLAGAATLGFRSMTAGPFNVLARQCQHVMTAVANNDIQTAQSIQDKISKAIEALGTHDHLSKMKAVMKFVSGIDMGPTRLPIKPASKEQIQQLKEVFEEFGFLKEEY